MTKRRAHPAHPGISRREGRRAQGQRPGSLLSKRSPMTPSTGSARAPSGIQDQKQLQDERGCAPTQNSVRPIERDPHDRHRNAAITSTPSTFVPPARARVSGYGSSAN